MCFFRVNIKKAIIPIISILIISNNLRAAEKNVVKNLGYEAFPGYTRVVIELSGPTKFTKHQESASKQLNFDLENSRLLPEVQRILKVDKGVLKTIEISTLESDTVRVTLKSKNIDHTSESWLENPTRLTIDIFPERETVEEKPTAQLTPPQSQIKDRIFLMGLGMLRLNWTEVRGNEIRFRYSDLGLPADFSTRERASFVLDGTYGHGKYEINGQLNYDPENRITEPPLDFLITTGNDNAFLSIGDYRMGVLLDSVFTRYYHPFRGGILGKKSNRLGVELVVGAARGQSGLEEIPAEAGAGPYYLRDSPILRGSEVVYLIVKSAVNPDRELKRTPMIRNNDYFIDYDRGSIIFNYPLYSSDEMGNPVSLMVSYQFESLVGRFTRDVFGFRSFFSPVDFLKFSFLYIADADRSLSLSEAWRQKRGISALGLNINTELVNFFGEFSLSSEPAAENQHGYFGGGSLNLHKNLHLYFNAWKIDSEFPTFANRQLEYGYSLNQIFPAYLRKNIFLSPFQFTRNLGAELFPFSLSRLALDEREVHTFLEWQKGNTIFSSGLGERKKSLAEIFSRSFYLSSFHNGESTKIWGKAGLSREFDKPKLITDTGVRDILFGIRQKVFSGTRGNVFVQADYKLDFFNDYLELAPDTIHHSASFFLEYLTGNEGIFGGYRKRLLYERQGDKLLDADIYEAGIRRHIYKGIFVDTRLRRERSKQEENITDNRIISLGGGFESGKFRAMGRYELQFNKSNGQEGRRKLWSLFLFGSPIKGMSLSLRYYNQINKDEAPVSLSERSEEQLSGRLLWKVSRFMTLYSQWRYDTNIELLPPLDRTKSNSLASVQGMKLNLTKKMEFLANYKLLKIWGPIENKKEVAAAELGYLFFRHFRLGLGIEKIHFRDKFDTENNYKSVVGYFKLVALY